MAKRGQLITSDNMPSKQKAGTKPVASSNSELDRKPATSQEETAHDHQQDLDAPESHTIKELMCVTFVAIVGIFAFYFVNLHIWFG